MKAKMWLATLPLVLTCCASSLPQPARPGPNDPVVSRDVVFDVAAPRRAFVTAFLAEPLATFLPGTAKLPGVQHTEPLTAAQYPGVGSVRLVVLRDGQSAHEEVLESDERHLKYLVTWYTSPAARPVEYGLGEFTFDDRGQTTRVHWRYSFKLRRDRFPGCLGGLGRSLFRSRFLQTDYADFMATGVDAIRAFGGRVNATESPDRVDDASMP